MDEEVTYQEEYYPNDNGRIVGIVNVDVLNVREQPDIKSKSVKVLRKGDVVEILNEIDGWYDLAYPNNGYCKTDFIEI